MPKQRRQKSNSGMSPRKSVKPMQVATSTTPLVHDLIARKLRSYYDEVAREPVPDRFTVLLNQLDAKTSPKKSV